MERIGSAPIRHAAASLPPCQHHAKGEIRGNRPAGGLLAQRFAGNITSSGSQIEQHCAGVNACPPNNLPPPGNILSSSHQAVHQIIARRNAAEHALHIL